MAIAMWFLLCRRHHHHHCPGMNVDKLDKSDHSPTSRQRQKLLRKLPTGKTAKKISFSLRLRWQMKKTNTAQAQFFFSLQIYWSHFGTMFECAKYLRLETILAEWMTDFWNGHDIYSNNFDGFYFNFRLCNHCMAPRQSTMIRLNIRTISAS